MTVRNRRGAHWQLEDRPWAPSSARKRVLEQLRKWNYTPDEEAVGDVVTLLTEQVVQNTGARVSLHLSPREDHALVVLLSHQADHAPADTSVLRALGAIRVVASCGTDTSVEADDGPSVWAVIDLTAPKSLSPLRSTLASSAPPASS
ncbi:hypothetical protein [Streptomyces noursei]